jgi:peptidoglycan hydrolase CwlO-like protein
MSDPLTLGEKMVFAAAFAASLSKGRTGYQAGENGYSAVLSLRHTASQARQYYSPSSPLADMLIEMVEDSPEQTETAYEKESLVDQIKQLSQDLQDADKANDRIQSELTELLEEAEGIIREFTPGFDVWIDRARYVLGLDD